MIEFEDDKRKWLFAAAGVVCLLAAFAILASFRGSFGRDTARSETITVGRPGQTGRTGAQAAGESGDANWVVYVTGAVMRPGVYELPQGSRVNEAVKSAGGFSIHADPEGINLAAKLADGAHVKVPERTNEANRSTSQQTPAGSFSINSQTPQTLQPTSETRALVDLNRATHAELCTLPGIGPKLAQSIIDHRENNGPFGAVEDVCQVSGIGTKKMENIREFVLAIN